MSEGTVRACVGQDMWVRVIMPGPLAGLTGYCRSCPSEGSRAMCCIAKRYVVHR